MELEIRDVQSSQLHRIAEQGMTIGRQGSTKADLTVPDKTVSSRHARIYARDGGWWLEDLRSSNGTFVDGERISVPTRLKPGTRFAFCRYTFEVVGPAGRGAAASTAVLENAGLTDGLETTNVSEQQAGAASSAPRGHEDRRPVGGFDAEVSIPAADADAGFEDGFGSAVAYFFATLPKATAFYVAAIPAMLLNPIGTVRKGIAEPRFGALAVRELIAYALPALLVTVLLPGLVGFIVTTVRAGFAAAGIIGLFISIVIALVAAIVTGLIWHPLLRWLVRLLKGESDQVSRSNYFVMVYTAVAISGLAGALAVAFGLLPVPFITIFPILMTLAGSLIVTWVAYNWFVHFRVMKWFPILILIGGLLSCIGAVRGIIDTIRVDVARLGTDSPTVAAVAEGDAAMPAGVDDVERSLQRGEHAAENAAEVARQRQAAAPVEPSTGTAPSAMPEATPHAAPSPAPAAGVADTPVAGAAPAPAAPAPRPAETAYEVFLRRRRAIKEAINRNPTLMKRKDVRRLYKEMEKITIKVTQKHKVKIGKRATPEKLAQKRVEEKLRDAQIFEQTATLVEQLHRKVVESP